MKRMMLLCLCLGFLSACGFDGSPKLTSTSRHVNTSYTYSLSTDSADTEWVSGLGYNLSSNPIEDDCRSYFSSGMGVLRSWYLKERNRGDMRRSYHFCRRMKSDGTMSMASIDKNRRDHFEYQGSGTTQSSTIPSTGLPIGITVYYTNWNNYGNIVGRKIYNLFLVYHEADEVGTSASIRYAGGATNRTRNGINYFNSRIIRCSRGYVATGIRIYYGLGTYDGNIEDVALQCTRLVRSGN